MTMMRGLLVSIAALFQTSAAAQPAKPFDFNHVTTLDDMRDDLRRRFPLETSRGEIRAVLARAGATPIGHPTQLRVEKYIYDIDLCGYYVWRWNVSVDYNEAERVRQIYVNGEPIFADGGPVRRFDPGTKKLGQKESISRGSRPRPQAHKGESSLAYLLYDLDSDARTLDDQQLIGGGPTRADPLDMGRMHVYRVEPWRSIFDGDEAPHISPYAGDCAKVDLAMARRIGTRRPD